MVSSLEHLRERQCKTWSVASFQMAIPNVNLRLVECNVVRNAVRQAGHDLRRVIGETGRSIASEPTTPLKESERVVPVKQRDPRQDLCLKQSVHQAIIEIHTFLIHAPDT